MPHLRKVRKSSKLFKSSIFGFATCGTYMQAAHLWFSVISMHTKLCIKSERNTRLYSICPLWIGPSLPISCLLIRTENFSTCLTERRKTEREVREVAIICVSWVGVVWRDVWGPSHSHIVYLPLY